MLVSKLCEEKKSRMHELAKCQNLIQGDILWCVFFIENQQF